MESKLLELGTLVLNAVILWLTQRNIEQSKKNEQLIQSTKQNVKKVYVALDAERIKKAMQTADPGDDLVSGELHMEDWRHE